MPCNPWCTCRYSISVWKINVFVFPAPSQMPIHVRSGLEVDDGNVSKLGRNTEALVSAISRKSCECWQSDKTGLADASRPVYSTGLQGAHWLPFIPHSCNRSGQGCLPSLIHFLSLILSLYSTDTRSLYILISLSFQEKTCYHNHFSAKGWKPWYESLAFCDKQTGIRPVLLKCHCEIQGQYLHTFP